MTYEEFIGKYGSGNQSEPIGTIRRICYEAHMLGFFDTKNYNDFDANSNKEASHFWNVAYRMVTSNDD